jgi:AcrR family transcriptional regulator
VSSKAQATGFVADPLPRGRHKIPRAEVKASQRDRLLRAMAELVGEQGYEATTVPQVVATARVARNSFYEFFEDKADCFVALCDELGKELWDELAQFSGEADARTALRRGLVAYLEWWQARPVFTRAYFVELPLAGTKALENREAQYARFEQILRYIAGRARLEAGVDEPVRDVAVTTAVIGITELVAKRVRANGAHGLVALADELEWMLQRLLF